MAIVLNFDGVIAGGSELAEHEDWIDVMSMSTSVHRNIPVGGAVNDRQTAMSHISDLNLVRLCDVASNELGYQAMCGIVLCPIGIVRVLNQAGSSIAIQQETAMKDPMIASYNVVRSGDDTPTEDISINFTAFATKWNVLKEGTTALEGKWQGVDLATGQPWTPE